MGRLDLCEEDSAVRGVPLSLTVSSLGVFSSVIDVVWSESWLVGTIIPVDS